MGFNVAGLHVRVRPGMTQEFDALVALAERGR